MDLRSLALFRITLAWVILCDLAVRFTTIKAFYTDDGVLPREVYIPIARAWPISINYISGEYLIQVALFVLTALFTLGLLLGYRTRLCTVVSWFLLYSIHTRNDYLLYGGDNLARLLLFWSMFAPLGARFSLDYAQRPTEQPQDDKYFSLGAAAILLQMVMMYFFTGLQKSDPIWWSEGSALYYTLNLDVFVTTLGKQLLFFPKILKPLGWGTLFLELVGPFVILIARGRFRIFMVAVFVGFHLSHFLTLDLGIFPFVSIAGWLAFLPAEFWQYRPTLKLSAVLNRTTQRLARYFPAAPVAKSWPKYVVQVFVGLCIALCLLSNFKQLYEDKIKVPAPIRNLTSFLALDQYWNMFAPYPMTDDGWFVFDGTLKDGTRIDVFRNAPVTFEKPEDVSEVHGNYIWYTYLHTVWQDEDNSDALLRGLARYICRDWNDVHKDEKQLDSFEISYVLETTPPPGEPIRTPVVKLLWEHYCFGAPTSE